MQRPYGATPIGGMLADAEYFFLRDGSPDPLAPSDASKPARKKKSADGES